ncbi:hypothetical protein FKP32DRAFT_1591137, partial [Trametes sanguinea]
MRIPGIKYARKQHLNWCSYKEKELRKAAHATKESPRQNEATPKQKHARSAAGSSSSSDPAEHARMMKWLREQLATAPDPPLSVLCRWADALAVSVGDVAVILRKLTETATDGTGEDAEDAFDGQAYGGGGGDHGAHGTDVDRVGAEMLTTGGSLGRVEGDVLDNAATYEQGGTWQTASAAADTTNRLSADRTVDVDAKTPMADTDYASPYGYTHTAYSPSVFSPTGLPYADGPHDAVEEPSGVPAYWAPEPWMHPVDDAVVAQTDFANTFCAVKGSQPRAYRAG